jgi:predicted TIM-barrel fold metal-dependent hydrolase
MSDTLLASDFVPRSELVVPQHEIPRSKYPAIDAHNHLPISHPRMRDADVGQLVREMDFLNVRAIVNLSGGTGDELKRSIEKLDAAYPGRFSTFCNIDWAGMGEAGWTERATAQLEADLRAGARGLKIFAPLWDKAGELNAPVLIHVADPVAFFRPLDRLNERWDELHRHPDWHFYGPPFPAFHELIDSLYRLIEAHPRTNFITAHVGCYPENLEFVSQMMDRYPNFYTDISARIAELGRAPYSARTWFIRYADRILFGTDSQPRIAMYQAHFRFLETADEYFDYAPGAAIPPQGRWKIYGVFLPDDVLQQVYHENAVRLGCVAP